MYCCSLIGKLTEKRAGELAYYKQGGISQITTVSSVGFIIKPEPESIRIAWDGDLSSRSLSAFVERHEGKVKHPYELLNLTHAGWNEMVVGGPKTSIEGIFYRQNSNPESEQRVHGWVLQVQEYAQKRLGKELPLIALPEIINDNSKNNHLGRRLHVLSIYEFIGLGLAFDGWKEFVDLQTNQQ